MKQLDVTAVGKVNTFDKIASHVSHVARGFASRAKTRGFLYLMWFKSDSSANARLAKEKVPIIFVRAKYVNLSMRRSVPYIRHEKIHQKCTGRLNQVADDACTFSFDGRFHGSFTALCKYRRNSNVYGSAVRRDTCGNEDTQKSRLYTEDRFALDENTTRSGDRNMPPENPDLYKRAQGHARTNTFSRSKNTTTSSSRNPH